ncbi:tumor necrosis factor receptor superfamily member 5-like [Hypanus sabinus]|uniref:tumor necrosis factor receptor superfamily member 5-like n=1 Tax=Hypanus sabinus TaxID=79690 RepID=UPI0028C49B56|nr:tumor necrosis factor receptor superfamily member 5-like [Hypanus sabinus]
MDWLLAFFWSVTLPFCISAPSINCDSETQYLKDDRCCFKCGPGSYMATECGLSQYPNCHPCENGSYQQQWNKDAHCKKHSSCDSGEFEVVKAGDSISDVVCLCKEGKHCPNSDCEVCRDDEVCPPGSGVKIRGDRKFQGTVCEDCKEGFYSNVTSSIEPCREWMNCASLGLVEVQPGTSQNDVVCSVPLPSKGCCKGAVIPLALIIVVLIILFVCDRLGYLNAAKDAIRRRMTRGKEEEDVKGVACADRLLDGIPTPESGLHAGIQEEGKDSHPSEEEQNHIATSIGREDFICGQDANGSTGRQWVDRDIALP